MSGDPSTLIVDNSIKFKGEYTWLVWRSPAEKYKNVKKFEEIAAFVLARSLTNTLKYEVHSDFIYSLIVSDWKLERN